MTVERTLQLVLDMLQDSHLKFMRGESLAQLIERVEWEDKPLAANVAQALRAVPLGNGSEVTEQFLFNLLTPLVFSIESGRNTHESK